MPTEEDIAVELGQSVLPSRQDGMVAASRDHRRVLQYTASVRPRSRPTRHDTRQMQNSLANNQQPTSAILLFYLAVISSAWVWRVFVIVPYRREFGTIKRPYGYFFFWSFVEEPRGYAKGRKREIKKMAQCRVLIIFVIVPEPVER